MHVMDAYEYTPRDTTLHTTTHYAPDRDIYQYDLPSELWFKIIAFVLSDSIYAVCCPPQNGAVDTFWEERAFGTIRLVSKLFNDNAVKVADLALPTGHQEYDGGAPPPPTPPSTPALELDSDSVPESVEWEASPVVEGDDRSIDKMMAKNDSVQDQKLKLLYDRFNLVRTVQSNTDPSLFFAASGISLLSAYYGYVQLLRNCKLIFSRDASSHLEIISKVHGIFPVAFKNILTMLHLSAVPEMVDRLRRDVERDWRFVTAGLEIVYRCAQIMARKQEWDDYPTISEFRKYLDDLYEVMWINAELYDAILQEQSPGEFPAISGLPGVRAAAAFIAGRDDCHHPKLPSLVRSWL